MTDNVIDLPSWQTKVQDRAIGFAAHVTHRFHQSVKSSLVLVPKEIRKEQAHVVLDSFLDAFVGSIAMVAIQYAGGTNYQLEEALVNGFRHKFSEMRKANLDGAEREMAKAIKQRGDEV